MVAATEHHATHAYTMSHKNRYLLVAVYKDKQDELPSCFSSLICGERWHIIYSLVAVMEVLTK